MIVIIEEKANSRLYKTNRNSKIIIDDFQLTKTDPFKLVQRLIDYMMERASWNGSEESEFFDVVDILTDEKIRFFSNFKYEQ